MQPNKRQIENVAMMFSECLASLYIDRGLDFPEEFDPEIEAQRLIKAFKGEK